MISQWVGMKSDITRVQGFIDQCIHPYHVGSHADFKLSGLPQEPEVWDFLEKVNKLTQEYGTRLSFRTAQEFPVPQSLLVVLEPAECHSAVIVAITNVPHFQVGVDWSPHCFLSFLRAKFIILLLGKNIIWRDCSVKLAPLLGRRILRSECHRYAFKNTKECI